MTIHQNKFLYTILALSFVLACSGCQHLGQSRHKIQQGNTFTEQQVNSLHTGMSKAQVASAMGTPVHDNTFNLNHWEYIYSLQIANHLPIIRRATVLFANGKVTEVIKFIPGKTIA